MPKRESGFSHSFIILGVVAAVGLFLYFSANSNKNQQVTQEIPAENQEQTKEEIENVPNPVNEFLSSNDIEEYEKAGMKVYTGNNPPNIEGLYASDSLVIFYDKPFKDAAPVGTEVSSYNHQFYDQKSDGTIKLKRISLEGGDEAEGVGGFISGDNDCFSIFVNVKDQSDQCSSDQATIYSACKVEAGLEGLQAGFILKKQMGSGCGVVVPVGHLRIITEDDSLAERIE